MKNKKSILVYSTDPDLRKKIADAESKTNKIENVPPDKQHIKVLLQTKGRKGKKVTVLKGFQHDSETMSGIARQLKKICSTGGTVKDQTIEIQGDQRQHVSTKLMEMGYHVQGK